MVVYVSTLAPSGGTVFALYFVLRFVISAAAPLVLVKNLYKKYFRRNKHFYFKNSASASFCVSFVVLNMFTP
jgi:hypothetical protein